MTLPDGMFNQKVPCADCPFKRDGGVRHTLGQMAAYASYFVQWPGSTFPCHKSVPKDDDRAQWSEWRAGQVLCAGGIIFARKLDTFNAVMAKGAIDGVFDANQYSEEAKAQVFDSLGEMLNAAEPGGDDGTR